MFNKETNTYTCMRCGQIGYASIYVFPDAKDVCTGCANYLRLGDLDPLDIKTGRKIGESEE